MPFATAQEVEEIKSQTQRLVTALAAHPGMFSNPRNMTVFFTWDFVNRTLSMIDGLDVTKDNAEVKELYTDILGRNVLAKIMINDTTGKTVTITGGDPSNPTDFGTEVKAAANAIS